jgi:chemotaxis family two-component system sensor kinase Cph1
LIWNEVALPNDVIVNLDTCAKEPIHIPGTIQPHGVLFVLSEPDLIILQISENCGSFLGFPADKLLGKGLNAFLNTDQVERVRFALASTDPNQNNPVKLQLMARQDQVALDAMVHRQGGFSMLELEPSTPANESYFLDFFKLVSTVTGNLQAADNLESLLSIAAHDFRRVTGFDRVMIYRFSASGAGEVVAESRVHHAEPYLGLWYPASDIPEQARKMYVASPIRCIPHVSYVPSPLIPVINPVSSQPADLSFATLRSVSPIHCEYLKNMGVTASMSVSIIRDDKLWGLVSCHHFSPRFVPYENRKAATFLGQVLSGEIIRREVEAEASYSAHANETQARFLEIMAASAQPLFALLKSTPNLMDMTSCTGAAVIVDNLVRTIGVTPSHDEILALPKDLHLSGETSTFITHSLKNHFLKAAKMNTTGSGVIALTVSENPKQFVFFFRPEVAQTVTWGGNPNKPVITTDNGYRLTPRQSFAAWREEVQGSSLPWSPSEVRAINNLRNLIAVVLFKK